MGGVTAIYILIQIVAQGVLGGDLARSTTPLSDALEGFSPGLAGLLLAGAAISMSGYLAGNALSAPRLLFAAARDGFLPAGLAAIHTRTHAPAAAIIVHLGIAAALALTGTFIELAVLSTLATVGIYILGCAATLQLRRRGVATAGEPLRFRATVPAAFIGIASMMWVALQATPGEAISVAHRARADRRALSRRALFAANVRPDAYFAEAARGSAACQRAANWARGTSCPRR